MISKAKYEVYDDLYTQLGTKYLHVDQLINPTTIWILQGHICWFPGKMNSIKKMDSHRNIYLGKYLNRNLLFNIKISLCLFTTSLYKGKLDKWAKLGLQLDLVGPNFGSDQISPNNQTQAKPKFYL